MTAVDWFPIAQSSGAAIVLLAVACSALLVVTGLRQRRDLLRRIVQTNDGPRADLEPGLHLRGPLDVGAEVQDVILPLDSLAARGSVQMMVAVPPALSVRADQPMLRTVLTSLISHAIGQSGGGKVLVAAMRIGERVRITVTDDGPCVGSPAHLAPLSDAQRHAALQGWSLAVDPSVGQGATMVLLVPAAAPVRRTPAPTETANASVYARSARSTVRVI